MSKTTKNPDAKIISQDAAKVNPLTQSSNGKPPKPPKPPRTTTTTDIPDNPDDPRISNALDQAKREAERAYRLGSPNWGEKIETLCVIIAHVTTRRANDPSGAKAPEQDHVSDNGDSKRIRAMRRDIRDTSISLQRLCDAADVATHLGYNAAGDLVSIVDDPAAECAITDLIHTTIADGDGYDLVHTAVVAILEAMQYVDITVAGWLDAPYTVRKLRKRVYSAVTAPEDMEYVDEIITPIIAAYRAVRKEIDGAKRRASVTTYTYTELDTETTEHAYYRKGIYAGINGKPNTDGETSSIDAYRAAYAQLSLTPYQLKIMELIADGNSERAVADKLGVKQQTIHVLISRIRARAKETLTNK